ncbi:MAG: T9SS type A sorting domain-containing protein [Bacteroidota bacterium]
MLRLFFILLFLVATLPMESVRAQPPLGCSPPRTRASLIVQDAGSGRDTLWFGFDIAATYTIDPLLCEVGFPFIPPTGAFHTVFVNIPGREGLDPPFGLGQGTEQDYRSYEGRADVDTHRVKFYAGDAGFPFTFRWSRDSIMAICDSAILQDEFGGIIYRVRMHIDSQATIPSPAFTSLLIIRYGAINTVSDVRDQHQLERFQLAQNYPNPFNPSTMINYQLTTSNWVTLRVYNILGQEVRTLVNERKDAGEHRVEFNAEGLPSGVYVYRIQSGNYVLNRKMILLR